MMCKDKKIIIDRFFQKVKGKKADVSGSNPRHDGKSGHWLEDQMGSVRDSSNTPDLLGYEMKNQTTSGKTTFGDWSADYYIYKDCEYGLSRDQFLQIFGKPNVKKQGRYSWSGDPTPTIYRYNIFGQKLVIDENNNILAIYSFDQDQRADKETIVPQNMQKNDLIIAKWNADSLKTKLERKFGQKGWFKCTTDSNGIYTKIHFGEPIYFENWIELVKQGIVFFDSGMYQGNKRPYSQWRAQNSFWDSLITDSY